MMYAVNESHDVFNPYVWMRWAGAGTVLGVNRLGRGNKSSDGVSIGQSGLVWCDLLWSGLI